MCKSDVKQVDCQTVLAEIVRVRKHFSHQGVQIRLRPLGIASGLLMS